MVTRVSTNVEALDNNENVQGDINNATITNNIDTSITNLNNTNSRPEWLDQQFKTPEDLQKSYKALQSEFTKLKQQMSAQKNVQQEPTSNIQQEVTKAAEQIVQQHNNQQTPTQVDVNKYTTEFTSNGSLSPQSYQELEQVGIPKQVVDSYIQGQLELQRATTESLLSSVGGEQEYNMMLQWGSQNLTPEEQQAFDQMLSSNDYNQIYVGLQGLRGRYLSERQNKYPQEPSILFGNKSSVSYDTQGFTSLFDMQQAINDPRYNNDANYRRVIEQKVSNSRLFNR